ncbi:MAG: hypothetical protein VYC40_01860 [Pseudomonadota bacterium]|nr:hypothetical protein [Pseudomonadota bacterium]
MRAYIGYMADIYDFTEYKLVQLMEEASDANEEDLSEWLWFIFNEYLDGKVLISFKDGWPVVKY